MKKFTKDFIIVGSVDWQTNWQTQHRLVTSLISNNNRVLFIENTGIRNLNLNDTSRLYDRLRNRKKSINGFNEIEKGLNIFSPIIIPFPYSKFILKINKLLFFRGLSKWLKISKFNDPIIISFLPTPLISSLVNFLKPDLSIYYCANEMQGMNKKINKNLEISENNFFKNSKLVFVTSSNLKNKANKLNNNVYTFSAAVEINKFNISNKYSLPKELITYKSKIKIGYIGAITRVLDIELINYLLPRLSNYVFVFVGRVYVNIDVLLKHKNFIHISEKKHSDIPNYIFSFDTCLVPYKVNSFTDSVYSCKINEYLAMGKPIISTSMLEIQNFNKKHDNIIYISENFNIFLDNIKKSLLENNQNLINQRIDIAKSNSWEKKFSNIIRLIEKNHSDDDKINFNWKVKYTTYLKDIRNYFIKLFISFIFIFYIIFYSPLISYVANSLITFNKVEKSEAIVLFTGYGSADYVNIKYQERVKEVLKLYKDKYAKKIYLSGRKQNLFEQEIVNSLLLNYGIPKNVIVYKNNTFKSTYDEISQMSLLLKADQIDKFIFVTSPFHLKRSKLIWEKNFPDFDIIYYKSNDKLLSNNINLFEKINLYKIVIYEYLSIFFNKIKGRF